MFSIQAHLFVKQQLQAKDCLLQFHRYSKKSMRSPQLLLKMPMTSSDATGSLGTNTNLTQTPALIALWAIQCIKKPSYLKQAVIL